MKPLYTVKNQSIRKVPNLLDHIYSYGEARKRVYEESDEEIRLKPRKKREKKEELYIPNPMNEPSRVHNKSFILQSAHYRFNRFKDGDWG